ncbi:hypothetical protein LTR66_017978, partial [Elasticomyces elasticus]
FEFGRIESVQWMPDSPLYEMLNGGPNRYPPIPGARQIIQEYMEAVSKAATKFVRLVAMALELSEHAFDQYVGYQDRLKIVRYPASETAGQGLGPHKDSSGWWTFLLQASPPHVNGLQVLNKAGQWIDVPNKPGTFVVNIGQAFEVLTHGACKATIHRVVSGGAERYSVPFFLGVKPDLTRREALTAFADHFEEQSDESVEGSQVDSSWLRGKYDVWGEAQLRTKIRSHRNVGKKFYPEVYEQYLND